MVLEKDGIAFMQASSGLSLIGSIFVMYSIYKIKGFDKIFLKSVFWIAFSDFWASVATVIGGTKSGSSVCYFQGLVSNYFELTSFLWTSVIAYQVYLIVYRNTSDKNMTRQALICWLPPFLFCLLPLSNSSYSNDDVTTGWCFVSNSNDKFALLWFLFSFFIWLWLAFIFIVYVVAAVTHKLYFMHVNHVAKPVVFRLIGFPIILFTSWLIPSIVSINEAARGGPLKAPRDFVLISAYVLPTIQGFLNACYFFGSNPQYFTIMFTFTDSKRESDIIASQDSMRHSDFESVTNLLEEPIMNDMYVNSSHISTLQDLTSPSDTSSYSSSNLKSSGQDSNNNRSSNNSQYYKSTSTQPLSATSSITSFTSSTSSSLQHNRFQSTHSASSASFKINNRNSTVELVNPSVIESGGGGGGGDRRGNSEEDLIADLEGARKE